MNRDWKPGDVAMSRYGAVLCCRFADGGIGWVFDDSSGSPDNAPACLRPLVVIDPEDRAQVERLLSYYVAPFDDFVTDRRLDHMQAALREYANPTPPKPEEPTGWLAAVEDPDTDRQWYRDGWDDESPWRQHRNDGVHARNTWVELPPSIRVLSVGVTG